MSDTVLVVEDETDVVDLLRYNLSRAGFEVLIANNGIDGLRAVEEQRPDAVVLDLMLPGMDGYEVCRKIRQNQETLGVGIVMLTAKGEPEERVKGLEIGADDYVTKPFSPRELVLRVQAVLRRLRTKIRPDMILVDGFEVDRSSFEVRIDGRRLELTTIEFKLLSLLIERRGRVQTRETLLFDVWGYNNAIDTRTVDTHVRRLREKLGERASRLETVRGEGYRFSAVA
ncbi:MAG: response regulator transcription factor [Terrimicrobiaceae bacterium]